MSLRDIDVTDIAEDDEKLKQKYLDETKLDDASIGDWKEAGSVSVIGPYDHTTAVIIKINSGIGTVRFISGKESKKDYQTHPSAQEQVMMVLLPEKDFCYVMLKAQVREITRKTGL